MEICSAFPEALSVCMKQVANQIFETLEKIAKFFNVDMNYLLGSSVTVTSDNPEPSYEDIEQMIARGSHGFSAAQKMKLIQLLSEIDL